MRPSSWFKLIVKSAIGAGVIASAELGVAFALRIIDWSVTPVDSTSLGRTAVWVVFIFATAVLGGVAVARHGVRLIRAAIAHRRALAAVARANVRGPVQVAKVRAIDAARGTAAVLTQVGAALAAGAGAGAAFCLVWIPLRAAGVPGQQIQVVALAAAAGLALGFVLAVLALYAAPIAAGAAATAAWVWAFGLASVWLATAPEAGRPWTEAQPPLLGVLDAPHLINPDEWWLGPNLMVALAAGIAVAVAATARWVGSRRAAVAVCGAAGPALVATSYVVVGPLPDLMPAYVASLLALTAGLVGSVATAVLHRKSSVRPTTVVGVPPALAPARAPTTLAIEPARRAAPVAIEAARPGPTPVTLEAEYATTQPDRAAAPVFEVTTKPARAARRVSPAPPTRIPDPVPVPPGPGSAGPRAAGPPGAGTPARSGRPAAPAATAPARAGHPARAPAGHRGGEHAGRSPGRAGRHRPGRSGQGPGRSGQGPRQEHPRGQAAGSRRPTVAAGQARTRARGLGEEPG